MTHRTDIDGLRAISVLSVLAFHLGISHVPSGFVGVDVFFVISGYLITGLIAADLNASRFSLARFYERRVRRIVPALAVVLAATALASAFVLYPVPFRDFARSLLAAALSVSNFYFLETSNYFATASDELPLLHTWSLAVEEQFYLVFPLLLAGLYKFPRRIMFGLLAAIVAASFIYSVFLLDHDPRAAFYLPHARLWEPGLGALLALRTAPRPPSPRVATIMGGLGLAIIGASTLLLGDTPFPGLAALPPCLGALMVLEAGRGGAGPVQRLLSWRPLAFIGLISYSLYLWHWPIIVLTRISAGGVDLSHPQMVFAAMLSLLLATLTWRYVENPCRRMQLSRAFVFRVGGVATAGLGVVAGVIIAIGGAPQRFPHDVVRLASYLDYPAHTAFREGRCFIGLKDTAADFDTDTCLRFEPGRQRVVLMGDSHAAHLWRALTTVNEDVDVLQATGAGCIPTIDARPESLSPCTAVVRMMYESFLPQHPGTLVILSAEWSMNDEQRLIRTFDWARAHHIHLVLVGPSMEYAEPLPFLLAEARQRGDSTLPERRLVAWNAKTDRRLATLAAAQGVSYVSMYELLCPGGTCRELAPTGAPMLFDRDHFTEDGALYAAGLIDRLGVLRP